MTDGNGRVNYLGGKGSVRVWISQGDNRSAMGASRHIMTFVSCTIPSNDPSIAARSMVGQ